MKKYSNKRYRYVTSFEDMETIYNISNVHALCLMTDKDYVADVTSPLRRVTRVQDGDRYYKITSMWIYPVELEDGTVRYDDVLDHPEVGKYVCTWIFDKTGATINRIHPSRVSKIANHVYKPAKAVVGEGKDEFTRTEDGKIVQSAKPILGYNQKFDNTEHKVVCYDLNSAYAEALADKIIDTYNPRYFDYVGKDEVGFKFFDDDLKMLHEGEPADIVFPIIESPYKDFARKYYEIKKTAPKGSKERDFAKQILVITVGLLQNTNPYLRAYIVGKCNERIEYFINKYKDKICMWNTDAVYYTERIEELDNLIGEDIGQFKIEYEGLFRQKGQNYQKVDNNETSYRGVMKALFDEDFNLLTDGLPKMILPYTVDKETFELIENKEYEYGETI